jgi:hypothetical protein
VLHFCPIDEKVGNVRNDGPDLIKRVSAEPVLL